MIKLRIEDCGITVNKLYVQLIPFYINRKLFIEDYVGPDDTIQRYSKYQDSVDTRQCLLNYLAPIAKRIEEENPYIKECNIDQSPERIKKSLSVYIEILFNHPDGLSQEEIDSYYRYAIRFSDHENIHSKIYTTSEISIVGMKPKNLEKAAIRAFKANLTDIKSKIKNFEIQKFGKSITTF